MPNEYNLTTWYAKRIIGDAAAQAANEALLQTGDDIEANTWILHRTNRGLTNPYGIYYESNTSGTTDKIQFMGGTSSTDTGAKVTIELDTGNLTVEGTSLLKDTVTIQNETPTLIFDRTSSGAVDWTIENNTNILKISSSTTSGSILDIDSNYGFKINPRLYIGYSSALSSSDTYILYVGGTANITGNTAIGGTLDVTSATTLNSTLEVTDVSTFHEYLYRTYSSNDETPMIWMKGNDKDNYLWQIGGASTSNKQYYGYGLKYIGSGSGDANYLNLIADNQNGNTKVIAIGIDQSGRVGIGANSDGASRLFIKGNTTIDAETNSQRYIRVYNSSTTLSVSMVIGDGNQNHGLHSTGYLPDNASTKITDNGWIICRNKAGDVVINHGTSFNTKVTGPLNVAGITSITNTTDSTIAGAGALTVSGGAYIGGDIYLGHEEAVVFHTDRNAFTGGGWAYNPIQIKDKAGTTFARIGVYGSAATMAYIYIGANDYSGNNLRITPNGNVRIPSTTSASSTSTGALTVGGGVGIGGALYVGGAATFDSSLLADTMTITNTSAKGHLNFSREGANYILIPDNSSATLSIGKGASAANSFVAFSDSKMLLKRHLYLNGTASSGINNTTQITFTNSDTTKEYVTITANTGGALIIRPTTTSDGTDQVVLLPGGKSEFKTGTLTVGGSGQTIYTFKVAGTTNITGATTLGSTLSVGGNTSISGNIILAAGKHLQMTYDSTNYGTVYNHNNGNVSFNAASKGVFIGYYNTTLVNLLGGQMIFDSDGLTINPTTASSSTATGALIVKGGVGIAKALYVGGDTDLGGTLSVTNTIVSLGASISLKNNTRDLKTANNGSSSNLINYFYVLDKNDNGLMRLYGQSKSDGTVVTAWQVRGGNSDNTGMNTYRGITMTMDKAGTLSYDIYNVSAFRSAISAASSTHTHGNITNDGCITTAITIANGDYIIIGDNSASGKLGKGPAFDASTTTKCLTQKGTWVTFGTSNLEIGTTSTTAMAGNTTVNNVRVKGTTAASWRKIILSSTTGSTWDSALADDADRQVFMSASASVKASTGELKANKVYNAVWNDYAECRSAETEEPGYCVTETDSGTMVKTSQRLEPGCKIISDTYGTCMGETEYARTPIAVSGRVLAYPYRAPWEYPLGAAVCSAPGGKIDLMSRDEIMMYPERIVGTVSEIPTYETWRGGGQDGHNDIKVKGRIWIYVR